MRKMIQSLYNSHSRKPNFVISRHNPQKLWVLTDLGFFSVGKEIVTDLVIIAYSCGGRFFDWEILMDAFKGPGFVTKLAFFFRN